MAINIKFYQVGCGDAIVINFLGNDSVYHNILIDGGTQNEDYYSHTFKKEIFSILERGEKLDLWIITHIHDDHIGGIIRFIEDKELQDYINLSDTLFWFNYTYLDVLVYPKISSKISISQAVTLRNFLMSKSLLKENITNVDVINFYGAKITVLSPDNISFENFKQKWQKQERKIFKVEAISKIGASINDYNLKIEDFKLEKFSSDTNIENNSSIAFLLEIADKRLLFSADSNPDIVLNSIRNLGWSETNKLSLNIMQLSHHGSKKNTSSELLALINCHNFIISSDGFGNKPYKETLVRVIKSNVTSEVTNLIFNYDERPLRRIFEVDGLMAASKYNFFCNFGMIVDNYSEINL